MKKVLYAVALSLLLTACGTTSQFTRSSQYAKMYEEKPLTLLVMPPINNSSSVDAKELLYTSISCPLAEAGYYVISPMLAMDVLRSESAYDAENFVEAPLGKFGEFFGADAVVFSEIKTWTKRGFGIATDIRYFIRSTKTNETLFDRTCSLYLDLSTTTGLGSGWVSALIDVAASALNTALTENIQAARMANYYIFKDIPRGQYHPDFGQDGAFPAEAKDVSKTVQ